MLFKSIKKRSDKYDKVVENQFKIQQSMAKAKRNKDDENVVTDNNLPNIEFNFEVYILDLLIILHL